jgi:hypothetical protein
VTPRSRRGTDSDDNQNHAANAGIDAGLAVSARSAGNRRVLLSASTRAWVSRVFSSKPTLVVGAGGIASSVASYVTVRVTPSFQSFWKQSGDLPKLGFFALLGLIALCVTAYVRRRIDLRHAKDMAKIEKDHRLRVINKLIASGDRIDSNPALAELLAIILDGRPMLDDEQRMHHTPPAPHMRCHAFCTLPRNTADDRDGPQLKGSESA